MLKKKYYKVKLNIIDIEKTIESVESLQKPDMIYVINHSETVPLRDVIVYKIFPNRFKELITGKEINASIEMFKADTDTFEYNYYINKKIPLYFKCNIESYDQAMLRSYPTLDTMIATDSEIEEYLKEHLGTNENEYKYRAQTYLNELNEDENKAIDRYYELLKYYGFSKKDKRKNAKYENKIKALVKKYESK